MQNILGLDPGRDKCGIAVINAQGEVVDHQVVDSAETISQIKLLVEKLAIDLIVMGDGTTSKTWRQKIASDLPNLSVTTVNETNSTLEARDRYWNMYPAMGLQRLIPQSLRTIPRPVDDIVAIILLERYFASRS
ncbi:MAG: pre-16S rRNA-processing nuclease YqgF [Cyanobacteria bacterium P01_C01_bin.72]